MMLIELSPGQLKDVYHTRMREDFPPTELKPLSTILALMRQGRYHAFGLSEETALVGYALMWQEPDVPFVLLDYLGTTPLRRGQGLGSQMLNLLAMRYCHLNGILAEAEAPESGPPENAPLRQRRLDFYYRNGFVYGGYDCALFGVHYKTLVHSQLPTPPTSEEILLAHQTIYHNHLSAFLYRRFVRLPLAPDQPVPPLAPLRERTPDSFS
ncbi:MAG: GNAT family N-acetyltransferase [Lawsonibacter sp.]|jgi:GNAT superfamily N-acetyltransferase